MLVRNGSRWEQWEQWEQINPSTVDSIIQRGQRDIYDFLISVSSSSFFFSVSRFYTSFAPTAPIYSHSYIISLIPSNLNTPPPFSIHIFTDHSFTGLHGPISCLVLSQLDSQKHLSETHLPLLLFFVSNSYFIHFSFVFFTNNINIFVPFLYNRIVSGKINTFYLFLNR